jgi:radical SAM superfamily enzyme YgiQ (UPF0313 family)
MADIAGIAYRVVREAVVPEDAVKLPSLEALEADREGFMAYQLAYQEQSRPGGKAVVQDQSPGMIVVNPPASPLSEGELDDLYKLPLHGCGIRSMTAGGRAGAEAGEFSITTHRGCFGGCCFCAIYFHRARDCQPERGINHHGGIGDCRAQGL